MKIRKGDVREAMEESRTKKTLRNTVFSFLYKFVDVILAFVLRTLFIRSLGVTYLGLNGLFTNILTVLSLMELGVRWAIIFSLYKPLAENNQPKIVALMQLYKKVYNTIGVLICIIGLLLTPYLKYIINLPYDIPHIYWIYWLTIANTSVTYFLSYRRSLLMADQRSDINTQNLITFRFIRFVLLTVALLAFKNYIIYLALDVLTTLTSNIQINVVIRKRYPYLTTVKPEPLTKEESHNIIKYMSSGVLNKVGSTLVASTDNIIISAFISTVLVGIYSDYSMVTNNLETMVYLLFNSISASVGNFAVTKGSGDSEALFKKVNFANYAVVFILTVALISLISPFVSLWVGEEYVLSDFTVYIILLNFYIAVLQKGIENFMNAVGEMFYKNRFRSIVEGVVNIIVSIVLVRFTDLGITGVFLGTTACYLCGRVWMDAHTLYKNWFKVPFARYLRRYAFQFILTAVVAVVCKFVSSELFAYLGLSWLSWILMGVISVVISVVVILVVFGRSPEFKYFTHLLLNLKSKIIK